MKRGATRQLTKDEDGNDRDDDGRGDDEEPQKGLQIADPAILARRPMKSLPKRRGAAPPDPDFEKLPKNATIYFGRPRDPSAVAPATTSTSEPEPTPKSGGFAGFDTAATNPFGGSTAAPQTPAATFSSATSFPFGPPSAASSNGAPAVSSSASYATKSFASFLSSTSTSTNGATASDKAEKTTSDDDALLKEEVDYLSHIRGLNMSLLTTVTSAIENDPFVDIGSLLETYQSLRLSEQRRFDEKVGGLKAGSAKETEKKTTSTPTSAFAVPSMPKTPSSFTFGAPPKPSGGDSEAASLTTSSKTSETKSAASSAFTFGSSSSTAVTAPSGLASSFSFGAPSVPSKGSGFFSLGKGRPSSDKSGDSSASGGSAFTFGKQSDEDKGSDADKDKDKGELKSAFSSSSSGGSLFGAPSSSSSGTSLFGVPSTPSAFTTPEKPLFSASSSTSSGFAFSTPHKFTLGAAPAPSTGGFGGFGKPPAVGSIGNPVGFGFGSPPKGEDTALFTSNATNPFVFGPPKDKQPAEASTQDADAKEASTGDEPLPQLFAGSVHDKEGEGEEDETTTHEIRSKVYKLVKDDEGQNRWAEQGVGVLRLKKHKENDSRRVLLRNSSTGKVVINFRIYSGMNAKAEKTIVSFIGHENGAQATYRIRTKTEEQANDLKSALNREIEFIRSKSPSS